MGSHRGRQAGLCCQARRPADVHRETEGLVTRDRHTHIARKSDRLMPTDAVGEAETLHWDIAALNSAEMVRCRVPDHTGAEPFERDERSLARQLRDMPGNDLGLAPEMLHLAQELRASRRPRSARSLLPHSSHSTLGRHYPSAGSRLRGVANQAGFNHPA